MNSQESRRACVYCASSTRIDPAFHRDATRLGEILATSGWDVVYGGGRAGSMGAVADGALKSGGRVFGVLPRFMDDLEWGHDGLTELDLVEDMRERKHRMLLKADAVIALPGGCGTFEELFEAMTLKRLGLFHGPMILVNTLGYYDAFARLMEVCIDNRFMNREHVDMWDLVDSPEEVIQAIANAAPWGEDKRSLAAAR